MAIKRYIADADNTITNAHRSDLSSTNRATGSNMGESDILEVFSVFGQSSGSSGYTSELSRGLVKFPVSDIITDRNNDVIPASGSVGFILRLFNAKHGQTLPSNFTLEVAPLSQSWEEGYGLDMEEYTDLTYDGYGSNWMMRASGSKWIDTATATLTWNANNRPDAGDTITITDAAGTEKAYLAAASQDLTTDPPKWHASNTTTTQVDSLQACIESANGHNGTITVSQDGTGLIMTLTQTTAGSDGNQTITRSGIVDDQVTISGFTGGAEKIGGNYHASPRFKQTFSGGYEDLEVDITHVVEQWIGGENNPTNVTATRKLNYGVGIYLTASQEAYAEKATSNVSVQNLTGALRPYYTKKFFARGSEFFFKRPCIEARWDSATKDNGGYFYYSSSLAPAAENLNTLYFYNYVRGQLRDIPDIGGEDKGEGKILVSLYSGSATNTAPSGSKLKFSLGGDVATNLDLNATGGAVDSKTGIYSCSFAITGATQSPLSTLFAVWHSGSHGSSGNASDTQYHTGTAIKPIVLKAYSANPPIQNYVTTTTNLKPNYHKNENARFRFHTREKNWSPNIYTKANSEVSSSAIEDAYYRIYRVSDNHTVIGYGTGSGTSPQTKGANISGSYSRLSYDISGSYFDLDMSLLEPDFAYGVKLVYYVNGGFAEQPEDFKFRVEGS